MRYVSPRPGKLSANSKAAAIQRTLSEPKHIVVRASQFHRYKTRQNLPTVSSFLSSLGARCGRKFNLITHSQTDSARVNRYNQKCEIPGLVYSGLCGRRLTQRWRKILMTR